MLIISAWWPWAQLIVLGLKDVENRSRATKGQHGYAYELARPRLCDPLPMRGVQSMRTMKPTEANAIRLAVTRRG